MDLCKRLLLGPLSLSVVIHSISVIIALRSVYLLNTGKAQKSAFLYQATGGKISREMATLSSCCTENLCKSVVP